MARVSVEIVDHGVQRRLASIAQRLRVPKAAFDAIDDVAATALEDVQQNTPRSEDSEERGDAPHMADLWYIGRENIGKDVSYEVVVENDYSDPSHEKHVVLAAMEKGSVPHIIRAKNAKALKFQGRNGETVFAKQVHHPGTDPHWMVLKAAVRAKAELARRTPFIRREILRGL